METQNNRSSEHQREEKKGQFFISNEKQVARTAESTKNQSMRRSEGRA